MKTDNQSSWNKLCAAIAFAAVWGILSHVSLIDTGRGADPVSALRRVQSAAPSALLYVVVPAGSGYESRAMTVVDLLNQVVGPGSTTISTTVQYFYFSTNLFQSNITLQTFFQTNVQQNTYLSNFFSTNYYGPYNYQSNFYATNIFYSDTYVSNYYTTNILNNSYVSNYFQTNLFTTEVITNVTYQYNTTNFTSTTVNAKNAYITNLIIGGSTWFTNTWPGPTNSVTLGTNNSLFYASYTPVSVTGFLYNASLDCDGLLTIRNLSSSNITLTLPPQIVTGDGLKQYTITNGFDGVVSLRVSYAKSNAVFRMFW